MKRKLGLVAVLLLAMLCICSPAMAAEVSVDELGDFRITDETTWGELIQVTSPERYASFTDEQKAYLETIYVNDEDAHVVGNTPRLLFYDLWTNVSSVTSNSATVGMSLQVTEECPYGYMELFVYENATGEVIELFTESDFDFQQMIISENVYGLDAKTKYRITGYASLILPAGYDPLPLLTTGNRYFTTY